MPNQEYLDVPVKEANTLDEFRKLFSPAIDVSGNEEVFHIKVKVDSLHKYLQYVDIFAEKTVFEHGQ